MHKKSMEAADTLKDSDDAGDTSITSEGDLTKDSDELKSESIAALRTKAQEHTAKLLGSNNGIVKDSCGFDCPPESKPMLNNNLNEQQTDMIHNNNNNLQYHNSLIDNPPDKMLSENMVQNNSSTYASNSFTRAYVGEFNLGSLVG